MARCTLQYATRLGRCSQVRSWEYDERRMSARARQVETDSVHPETPVEALMTPQPVVLGPTDTVADALALLERYPFRHLPVVQGNELVGIVSDRDLAFAGALPRGRRAPGRGPRQALRVEEIMHRDVRTLAPDAPARLAVQEMLEHRVGALPVVTRERRLEGIVTVTDFLRLFVRCACWPHGEAPSEVPVEACMSAPVLSAGPEEDLMEAVERLLSSRVRHLPVVAGEELVGMLSDRDARRALARLVREDRRIEAEGAARVPKLAVHQVMSRPCMTIERGRALCSAAYTLLECRIGALAVVERDRLVGILSQTDLLASYRDWSSFAA
jgi:CBS domain-containing protein